MSAISVDYGAMANGQAEIQATANAIEEKLDRLKSSLQKLEWTGSDRDAYQTAQHKWDQAMTDMKAVLGDIGRAVGTALENYQQTEKGNASLWG